jgi:putative transposase
MGRPSNLTDSQKLELVLALIRKEATGSELARKFGVSEASMYHWRDEFLEAGKSGLKNKRSSAESDELRRLKKELEEHKLVIGEYAFANDFLKKRLVKFP